MKLLPKPKLLIEAISRPQWEIVLLIVSFTPNFFLLCSTVNNFSSFLHHDTLFSVLAKNTVFRMKGFFHGSNFFPLEWLKCVRSCLVILICKKKKKKIIVLSEAKWSRAKIKWSNLLVREIIIRFLAEQISDFMT